MVTQRCRDSYKFAAVFFVLALLVSVVTACDSGDDSTFEQKRAAVVQYLKAYDDIDNSFSATTDTIQFPESRSTTADLLAFNTALSQYITACDGALSRLNELQPPSTVPETATHLKQTKAFLSDARQAINDFKQSISEGNANKLQQAVASVSAMDANASTINRATEQLLLTYNITDTEVNYQFRGE